MIKAFLRSSAIYTIPAFISRGLSIFLVPLYTRVLSPSDYGALDMLMVFGSIVNLTVALEVSQGVARYYSGEKNEAKKILYASTAFWFTLFCYTLFLILSLIFTERLSPLVMGVAGLERIFQLGMLYLWLNGLFYLIQNQFRWELRSMNYAVVSLMVTFVTATVAVSFAYGMKWGLTGILLGMIGGALIGCIYGIWHLRNSFRFCFHTVRLKEMLVFSIPLVPSSIAVFLSSYIDRMMLNHYMSLQEVGLYGVGFRLASVVGLVMVGFKGALTPLIYSYYQEAETPRQLAAIFRLFIVLSLFVFLGLSLFSEEILHLMTVPAFYSAEEVVVLLVPAILFSNMYIFAPGIGIAKKTYLFLWINVSGAIVCVGLNWLLIPVAGIVGAAGAKLLGYGAIFFAYMMFSQRLYHIPHEWWRLVGAVAIASMLAFLGKAMTGLPMINVLTKSLLFLPLVIGIFIFDLIKRSEMVQAYHMIVRHMRAIRCQP